MNVEALYERIAQLEAENLELKKQLLTMQKKVIELESRLLAYENAHTPPSLSKKKREPKEPSGKLGALEGHQKYERPEPEPDKTVEYKETSCSHCKSKLGRPFKVDRRIIEEIPEPRPVKVTEHLIHHYKCKKCFKITVARNKVPKGSFGWNLQSHVTLLKYADRLPLRKVVESLNRHYGLNISNTGVMKITNRTSKLLQREYWNQIMQLRGCGFVHVDETEIKVSRKTFWIWVFVGKQQTVFVIKKSRSKKVLEEILGDYKGTIVCDGWNAYVQYSYNLQRCWAHLLREAKELKEKHLDFSNFYDYLKKLYEKMCKIKNRKLSDITRLKWREKLEQRMKEIVDQLDSYKHFAKFATKLRNGLPYWFTCVINPSIETTNNIAERALRELVVQRKIIMCLRQEKGAETMGTINSLITTWKQQKLCCILKLFPFFV